MMRIGIDARLWRETGVGRYIRALYTELAQIDHENEYVWFFKTFDYENIDLPSSKWKKVRADINWHTVSEQLSMPWLLFKEKLDIVHYPYFSHPILYPKKFILTVHDLIYDHYKSGKSSMLPYPVYITKKIFYRYVMWSGTKHARKIITFSEASKREIIDHYNVTKQKIEITPEGVDLEDKGPISQELKNKISSLKPYLLYVGNAHPHKNLSQLIEAMILLNRVFHNLKLVLIGWDTFFYPALKKMVIQKGLSKEIIFLGSIPNHELSGWYKQAEAFITPTLMEGFGIPPLEAMSMGCPVLVSDIPVFRELYKNAPVYFDSKDFHSIAKTVESFFNNIKVRSIKIETGYEIIKNYNWRQMAEKTLRIYESCYRI